MENNLTSIDFNCNISIDMMDYGLSKENIWDYQLSDTIIFIKDSYISIFQHFGISALNVNLY